MKGFIFFARLCSWLTLALPVVASAQNTEPYPNYVVIGAFAHQNNAVHFTEDANKNSFLTHFEMNPNRNLYYVYVLTTYDSALAFSEALKLRKDTKYFDAWVYNGGLGERALSAPGVHVQDFNPATGQAMETVGADQKRAAPGERQQQQPVVARQANANTAFVNTSSAEVPAAETTLPSGEINAVAGPLMPPGQQEAVTTTRRKSSSEAGAGTHAQKQTSPAGSRDKQKSQEKNKLNDEAAPEPAEYPVADTSAIAAKTFVKKATTAAVTPEEIEGKDFLFQLYRADNLVVVEGEVEAIDFENSRRMATYPANKPVRLLMPSGKSKHISLVSQVFGYRKLQREFDPATPSDDLYLDNDGNLVVPFELVRLQKGDIAIMYNVFFFKDAAVMRPESRYEVNNLLDLLNENPDYKIRIHGHTNGNAAGKIIRMDKPGNFYSLANTSEGAGSAKKLSEERALVIKQYLVSSGVSEDRMQIKAWGGKKPIHDKHAVRANENVRVEIEILSE